MEAILKPRLDWIIIHDPQLDTRFGLYWAEATCECGDKMTTHAGDREGLLDKEIEWERIHFSNYHDGEMRRKLRREILKGEREPMDCECCGYHGLKNPVIVDGHVVGPECKLHMEKFPCRGGDRGVCAWKELE